MHFAYLDNGVGGHSSLQEAKAISQTVRNDIDQSSFVRHRERAAGTLTSVMKSWGLL